MQAAAEAKRREEEAAREQAEYERLKQEFSIEEEGVDVQQQDDKAKAMINAQIIAAIEEAKIIPVEHLAINLNLKTEVYFSSYRISLKSTFFGIARLVVETVRFYSLSLRFELCFLYFS